MSGAVGTPISGADTGSGKNGNEVNNVYLVDVSSGSGAGAIAGNGGFILTTFNNQVWYQPPITVPLYNGPIYINIGNVSISNNGTLSTASLTNTVANALNNSSNSGLSAVIKGAVSQYLKGMSSQGSQASTPDCFEGGAWGGSGAG